MKILAPVCLGKKWGFMNRKGDFEIPLQFDYAHGFYDGRAKVVIREKCGFINETGEFIIPPIYDVSKSFNFFVNGFVKVRSNGKPSMIDLSGKEMDVSCYEDLLIF